MFRDFVSLWCSTDYRYYCCIIGGTVVGSLSGSQIGVSGPAAGLAVIVAEAINQYGMQTFLVIGVLAGIIQLILGLIKVGFIADYFPFSVIKGMLAAIWITLILKQIPHALGYDVDLEGDFSFIQADGKNTFTEIFFLQLITLVLVQL